ncbi:hypothetical protein [Legionella oakridgensis]|uniref:Secreted endonuclease n=2 Tax=Legionella oakridgensis TaxID=29423 RepID=W0BAF4_9GAMM|nr:hypothetical protein [Legionella oakridgensis]AHE67523.1 hypothetical protein Loa_01978 [Legionella oakridgensis ATCC 33761 = DSM 21215]ETO92907.1 hypothetical protein LOR_84c24310 [Legionella oakridgensis RV-2-2007]KTD37119.1 secreted endonuclease [Legionella oakridgensis]STY20568.1 secreted endonuclease [Legionella longbeachae]
MIKYIALVIVSLGMTGCSVHDEHYYRMNPKALQHAMRDCPAQSHASLNCKQLEEIAARLQEMGYQLRLNPQEYGIRILALQETIAKQELSLKQNEAQPELKAQLDENKQQLRERLAVVKWLESPES